MAGSGSTGKTLVVIGAIGGALWLLSRKTAGAGYDPNTPPSADVPATATYAELTQIANSWRQWIYTILGNYGWASEVFYYGTGPSALPTELPQDKTTAARSLPQSLTDTYQQFFWTFNELFGSAPLDPADTTWATKFTKLQTNYAQLVTDLTPARLS